MIKINVQYENFEGETKEEELLFNLNKAEISRLELKYGGLAQHIEKLKNEQDAVGIMDFLEEIVVEAYGVMGEDNQSFVKTPAIKESFKYGPKFPEVLVKLLSSPDGKEVAKFLMGCMSAETRRKIMSESAVDPSFRNLLK